MKGTFFSLGLLFGNLPYDSYTLYSYGATPEDFANSLRHYQTWANIPRPALIILSCFILLGYIGIFIRLYKPTDDSKYFDYGTLLLYVLATCIYLTNLKTGVQSAVAGVWGDVDENTGINVIAASIAMAIFVLGGIVVLQAGLYYGEWEYQQRLEQFNKEEAEIAAKETEEKAKAPKSKSKPAPVEKIETATETTSKATRKQPARKRHT